MRPSMRVEKGGDGDRRDRRLETVLDAHADRGQAGAEGQQGDQVGQDPRAPAPGASWRTRPPWRTSSGSKGGKRPSSLSRRGRGGRGDRSPKRAMTVSPAIAVWPSATSTVAAAGRYTSTREPKRMRPMRSPGESCAPRRRSRRCGARPGRRSGRRRSGRCAASMHDAVALVVLARLVELGVEELARRVDDPGTRPATGDAVHVAIEDVHEDRDAAARSARRGRVRAAATPSADAATRGRRRG